MAPPATAASLQASIASQSHLPVTQLFRKGEIAGKGAYGAVHRGVHIATGSVVALKIINLDTADDDVEAIQKEVALLSQLRGGEATNCTQYYGCWLEGPRVWIVMDFASGGSVRTLMKATKAGTLEERFVVVITREVLVALSFLHKAGVIHRDIKAANILVTAQGRVVLCDFGVAGLLATTHSKRATFVGTPYWMAPEVISGSPYDTKADIWGLGITIYEMMMKTPPHSDQVPMRALVLISTGKPPRLPENVGSREMKDFVASCLKELPNDRIIADELSRSKWIKGSSKVPVSILKELLVRYDGWVQQGGVRESLAGDVVWEDHVELEGDLSRKSMSWEFETIRGRSDPDTGLGSSVNPSTTQSRETSVQDNSLASSTTSLQAPRSLRMLFEDSSQPPPLPDSFLRNNLGSSRERFHSSPSQVPPSIAASAPVNSSHLAPSAPEFDPFHPKGSVDDLYTAKPPNFAFPSRMTTPKPSPADEATARPSENQRQRGAGGFKFPPSPPSGQDGSTPPPGERSGGDTPVPGVAGVIVPAVAASAASSLLDVPPAPSSQLSQTGTTTPPHRRPRALSRPSTAPSDGSPKQFDRRTAVRKGAAPAQFQFPASSNLNPTGSTNNVLASSSTTSSALPSRPLTPSKEASSALSPPNPHHHPASRSLDGQPQHPRARPTTPSSVKPPPTPILRTHRATSSAEHDPDRGVISAGEGNGRLLPVTRPVLRKQVSMETMGSSFAGGLAVPGARPVALKDALQLSSAPLDLPGGPDLLPPSPSTQSPIARTFPISSQLATSGDASNIHLSSPNIHDTSSTSIGGIPPSSSQTSFASLSTSTSVSSATSLLTLPYGPAIRPLDYASLLTSDDVHAELVRCVDDLAVWLGVVENGLVGFLDGLNGYEGKVVVPEGEEQSILVEGDEDGPHATTYGDVDLSLSAFGISTDQSLANLSLGSDRDYGF